MTSASPHNYRLLTAFESLFAGKIYHHRDSTQGDRVALELYEDLYTRAQSRSTQAKYVIGVDRATRVANPKNKTYGKIARRGDGTLGEILHGSIAIRAKGFVVQRGPTVITEIGAEVKILAKAMIKQIDRVCGDLEKQVVAFNKHSGARPPISVAIVGVNHSPSYLGYEGPLKTTLADGTLQPNGKKYVSPASEAERAKSLVLSRAAPHYSELLLLEFSATNMPPYPFSWVNPNKIASEYNALLTRLAVEYEAKF